MNSVILVGRLTGNTELSYTPNTQTAVCRFTIAVDRPKKDAGADFIRITVWGQQGENCDRYLSKGRMVAVQGRLTTGSYKGKDGKTVYTTEVTADRVEFLGGKSENREQTESREQTAESIEKQAQDLFGLDDTFQTVDNNMPF